MSYSEGLNVVQTIMPAAIGFGLCLLALFGVRELLKETSAALKKRVKA